MFKRRTKQATTIQAEEIIGEGHAQADPVSKAEKQQQENHSDNQDGKPTKKVKKERSTGIGGSTNSASLEVQTATHQQFANLAYYNPDKHEEQEGGLTVLAGREAEETETELAKRMYLERVKNTKLVKQNKVDTKIYRGANNYADYQLTPNELENPNEAYKWKHGPTRPTKSGGAQNTCRMDYDQSLCKDWYVSGYCVFGNSCIYIHDRSETKSSYEAEKDFERAERERWKRINNPDILEQPDHIKDLEKFKVDEICHYCSKELKEPVEVSCRHIFCLKCASEMDNKHKKCCVCHKRLDGIMNNAEKTLKQQKQQYESMVKMAEKGKQLASAKRSKYKELNSLDVFTAQ